MEKIYLDKEGYENYLKEIEQIREKLKNNSKDISLYMSDDAYGDSWHDNFAYEQAMIKENTLRHELEKKLKGLENIEIIKENKNGNEVCLNSVVDILIDGEIETYILSGDTSSNNINEIVAITINSPLGKSIYKKKKGDSFTYQVDSEEISGTIVDIK